jgi:hypothetical protein
MGVGFGISVSVDAALVTPVLPSTNNRAKAMGIIPLANTLPQSLTSATVALIISTSHLAYSFQVWIR